MKAGYVTEFFRRSLGIMGSDCFRKFVFQLFLAMGIKDKQNWG